MAIDRSILKAALIAGGALLYGASPIDVVPELLAGPLGFGDDAIVLVAAAVAVYRILRRRRESLRAARQASAAPRPQPTTVL